MRIRSWKVIMVQGLRRSVESHATACQKWHPATLRRGFHATACQRRHPATLRRGFHATACQRSLGSSDTRPFSTRNHPGTTLVHRRQYPPNLDHMICHKHGPKTILQSIPIHPKSRNKPTSISIHIFLVSIHKTKTTNQRGKNPIPRDKSYNSPHILYKSRILTISIPNSKDPCKFYLSHFVFMFMFHAYFIWPFIYLIKTEKQGTTCNGSPLTYTGTCVRIFPRMWAFLHFFPIFLSNSTLYSINTSKPFQIHPITSILLNSSFNTSLISKILHELHSNPL